MSARWAVVTGAGTGIGAAVTRELLRAQVNVVAVGRREAPLDELRQSICSSGGEGATQGTPKQEQPRTINPRP